MEDRVNFKSVLVSSGQLTYQLTYLRIVPTENEKYRQLAITKFGELSLKMLDNLSLKILLWKNFALEKFCSAVGQVNSLFCLPILLPFELSIWCGGRFFRKL